MEEPKDELDFYKLFLEDEPPEVVAERVREAEIEREREHLEEKREWYKTSPFSKSWAATYDEALDTLVMDYHRASDRFDMWSKKTYKNNAGVLEYEESGTKISINAINARNIRKGMDSADMAMKAAIRDLKMLRLSEQEIAEAISPENRPSPESMFVFDIISSLKKAEGLSRPKYEKLANGYGITNKRKAKELVELAIVRNCRRIIRSSASTLEAFGLLVGDYKNQPNLSLRTNESIFFQQYSTPPPIAYLLGLYVGLDKLSHGKLALEPSAGNGMLTIASSDDSKIVVNELDTIRLESLKMGDYAEVHNMDAAILFGGWVKKFDMVVTNPPFGGLGKGKGVKIGNYTITDLDHLMTVYALHYMKDNGKAAIIIGGHEEYDEKGRITKGKNRFFTNYLYENYFVDDIININGDMFRKMGTGFNIRIILVSGRKPKPEFVPKLGKPYVVMTFEELYRRVMGFVGISNERRKVLSLLAQARVRIMAMELLKNSGLDF